METPELVLASASPRRKALLRQIGVHFTSRSMDVDESMMSDEAPEDYVQRLALTKAHAALGLVGDLPVLGADTTVVLENTVMGKPHNDAEAIEMLLALSGKSHRVLTAVAIVHGTKKAVRLSSTRVTFGNISRETCHRYWLTGEPVDKAGGYAIQGLGAVFVSSIEGSYSGVVGLPLAETCELLDRFDIAYWHKDSL